MVFISIKKSVSFPFINALNGSQTEREIKPVRKNQVPIPLMLVFFAYNTKESLSY